MKNHNYYMQLALNLAKLGQYFVKENPMVGCVIVKNNKIIADGFHEKFGENHAEINTLVKINFDAKNCDIYITLEPCSHFGKTPPCVDAIIKSNPKRVIIASFDINLAVAKNSSVKKIQDAGIEVIVGLLSEKERKLNRGFIKKITTGLPFVTCKIATSLDGGTALKNGESKWITGKEIKQDAFKLRSKNQALITGSGTILADNPSMNVRIKNLPSPIKIVMDRSGKITDKSLNIFSGEQVIITAKTPLEVLKMLGKMGINYCLIEAGSKINAAFLPYIDELIIYNAPIIMGEKTLPLFAKNITKMSNKITLEVISIEKIGKDIKTVYKFNK